jgi:hypothetical protein
LRWKVIPLPLLLSVFALRIAGVGIVCLWMAACSVTSKAVPAVDWTNPSPISYGTPLSATQLDATSSVPGTFSYSSSAGSVLPAGPQKLSVTFTPTDTAQYATVTASVTLTVEPLATPAITWSAPTAITYGTLLSTTQLDATESVPGTFVYSPAQGAVIPAGTQTLSVTFTPSDTNHAAVQASVSITVNQATPALSWATPTAITYGTQLSGAQLKASASVPGSYAYSPAVGTVLTAGTHTLSVTFTPTDTTDYTSASTSVALTVNQVTPHITWSPKAWLAVGAPLGSGQLNATAHAPGGSALLGGSFVYSPPAGTTFSAAGQQSLSVTFTPSDTTDFTTAQTSITMTASVFGVAAWGDSLTCGCSGSADRDPYPSELQQLITLPVVNMGVSGNTSTQIGVREGGVPAVVSVNGDVLPASGGVTVTFPTCSKSNCPTYVPVTPYGPAGGVSGTILGVHGTVTIDSTGQVLTFTRTSPGNDVSATGTPSFVVDTPYANYIPVIWAGRNDMDWTKQILSDIANQVATVPPGQDYLVMSIINENRPAEWLGVSGNTLYQWLIPFNEQLGSIYGSHYIDIRKVLVDAYDPTQATDVTDYQHDEVPSSLRAVDQQGTLINSIGSTDTTITVRTLTGDVPGVGSIIKIDNGDIAENVLVTAVSGKILTVTRGFGGNQTSHVAGAPIVSDDIVHLNAQGYLVVANAVAQYLSAYQK